MKILEITPYSAGGCGVFARVKQESLLLAKKGYKVMIFSSWFEKGTNKIMPEKDKIGKVIIKRFKAIKLGGESFMRWNFEDEALDFKPDVIIAHAYRHIHGTKALKIAKKIGAKCILVTHAPFAREKNRGIIGNIAVSIYDNFIGKLVINKFDKVFAITHWEIPYLLELGLQKEKIEYVPNGLSEDYFSKVKDTPRKGLIYTGRVAPIKNIEVVIRALGRINKFNQNFEIFGPAEKDYLKKLKEIIEETKMQDRIQLNIKNYDSKEQIDELDRKAMFILPSLSEGMPQSLIEAMARKCLVIGSDNDGNKDLIQNGKNGFLFKTREDKNLSELIERISSMSEKDLEVIRDNARKFAESFKWEGIIRKIEKVINS